MQQAVLAASADVSLPLTLVQVQLLALVVHHLAAVPAMLALARSAGAPDEGAAQAEVEGARRSLLQAVLPLVDKKLAALLESPAPAPAAAAAGSAAGPAALLPPPAPAQSKPAAAQAASSSAAVQNSGNKPTPELPAGSGDEAKAGAAGSKAGSQPASRPSSLTGPAELAGTIQATTTLLPAATAAAGGAAAAGAGTRAGEQPTTLQQAPAAPSTPILRLPSDADIFIPSPPARQAGPAAARHDAVAGVQQDQQPAAGSAAQGTARASTPAGRAAPAQVAASAGSQQQEVAKAGQARKQADNLAKDQQARGTKKQQQQQQGPQLQAQQVQPGTPQSPGPGQQQQQQQEGAAAGQPPSGAQAPKPAPQQAPPPPTLPAPADTWGEYSRHYPSQQEFGRQYARGEQYNWQYGYRQQHGPAAPYPPHGSYPEGPPYPRGPTSSTVYYQGYYSQQHYPPRPYGQQGHAPLYYSPFDSSSTSSGGLASSGPASSAGGSSGASTPHTPGHHQESHFGSARQAGPPGSFGSSQDSSRAPRDQGKPAAGEAAKQGGTGTSKAPGPATGPLQITKPQMPPVQPPKLSTKQQQHASGSLPSPAAAGGSKVHAAGPAAPTAPAPPPAPPVQPGRTTPAAPGPQPGPPAPPPPGPRYVPVTRLAVKPADQPAGAAARAAKPGQGRGPAGPPTAPLAQPAAARQGAALPAPPAPAPPPAVKQGLVAAPAAAAGLAARQGQRGSVLIRPTILTRPHPSSSQAHPQQQAQAQAQPQALPVASPREAGSKNTTKEGCTATSALELATHGVGASPASYGGTRAAKAAGPRQAGAAGAAGQALHGPAGGLGPQPGPAPAGTPTRPTVLAIKKPVHQNTQAGVMLKPKQPASTAAAAQQAKPGAAQQGATARQQQQQGAGNQRQSVTQLQPDLAAGKQQQHAFASPVQPGTSIMVPVQLLVGADAAAGTLSLAIPSAASGTAGGASAAPAATGLWDLAPDSGLTPVLMPTSEARKLLQRGRLQLSTAGDGSMPFAVQSPGAQPAAAAGGAKEQGSSSNSSSAYVVPMSRGAASTPAEHVTWRTPAAPSTAPAAAASSPRSGEQQGLLLPDATSLLTPQRLPQLRGSTQGSKFSFASQHLFSPEAADQQMVPGSSGWQPGSAMGPAAAPGTQPAQLQQAPAGAPAGAAGTADRQADSRHASQTQGGLLGGWPGALQMEAAGQGSWNVTSHHTASLGPLLPEPAAAEPPPPFPNLRVESSSRSIWSFDSACSTPLSASRSAAPTAPASPWLPGAAAGGQQASPSERAAGASQGPAVAGPWGALGTLSAATETTGLSTTSAGSMPQRHREQQGVVQGTAPPAFDWRLNGSVSIWGTPVDGAAAPAVPPLPVMPPVGITWSPQRPSAAAAASGSAASGDAAAAPPAAANSSAGAGGEAVPSAGTPGFELAPGPPARLLWPPRTSWNQVPSTHNSLAGDAMSGAHLGSAYGTAEPHAQAEAGGFAAGAVALQGSQDAAGSAAFVQPWQQQQPQGPAPQQQQQQQLPEASLASFMSSLAAEQEARGAAAAEEAGGQGAGPAGGTRTGYGRFTWTW
jgi:hypothetical protein